MQFSDIHIHALYNCDDGAKNLEYMYKMIDAAYIDGERFVCLTPHCHPGFFGENSEKIQESFKLLSEYAKDKYPDLQLALGNELRFDQGCAEWIADGRCLCMNNTNYVLVDFDETEEKSRISQGLNSILNKGYIPILAHAERYTKIRGNIKFLIEQKDNGVLIQVDTKSVLGDFGFGTKMFAKSILKNYLADFVSSDAHSLRTRPPGISETYEYIKKKYGTEYAEAVCLKNAKRMIFGR